MLMFSRYSMSTKVLSLFSVIEEKWHESSLLGIFKEKGSTIYSVIPS